MKPVKKLILALLLIAGYAYCGYLNYGHELGYFTHRFPVDDHRDIAILLAIVGPLGTPAIYLDSRDMGRYWRTKPLTKEERWEIFHKKYPDLDRQYFEDEYGDN